MFSKNLEPAIGMFHLMSCLYVFYVSFSDFGQHNYFYLWEHGRSVPQTPDGAGTEADLPRHLQLHQVTHQAGVWEAPTGLLPNVIQSVDSLALLTAIWNEVLKALGVICVGQKRVS